jgi:hypothetical protein
MKRKTFQWLIGGTFAAGGAAFALVIVFLRIPWELGPIKAYDGGPVTMREYTDENGLTIREEVDSNETRHGSSEAWHEGKKIREGRFQDDLEEGTWRYWYPDGSLQIEGTYKSGSLHGRWVEWHEDGQVAAIGEYWEGNEKGPWTFWKEGGTVDTEGTGFYEDGKKVRDLEESERADPAGVTQGESG